MYQTGFILFISVVVLLWHHSRTQIFLSHKDDIIDKAHCLDVRRSESWGTISNHGYPNFYHNHTSCTWLIVGKASESITIRFDDLDIAEDTESCDKPPCCTSNWLKINSSREHEKIYCGQGGSQPDTYFSFTNTVRIKFHTATSAKSGRGFHLSYVISSKNASTCQENEFHCSNKKCIPIEWRCNKQYECEDHSDEKCCPPDTLMCMGVCYEPHKRCDGIIHCPDYSDELNCGYCAPNFTQCGPRSRQCYNPFLHRCNRFPECENSEDERGCTQSCQGKIMCASGIGCYSVEERCNAIAQCRDASDEKNCGPDLCKPELGRFLCNNTKCIREAWRCDRSNDCGDGSDETNCLKNSVITAAVMGSLICGLLLVIAVSCTCRLYSLRFIEQQASHYETPLSRFGQEFFFRDPPPSYAVAVGEHHSNLCVENLHYDLAPRHNQRRTRRPRRHHHHQPLSSQPPTLDNLLNHNCIVLSQNHSSLPSSLPAFVCSSENISTQPPSRQGSISIAVANSVISHLENTTETGDLQTSQSKDSQLSVTSPNVHFKRGDEISCLNTPEMKDSNTQMESQERALFNQHQPTGSTDQSREVPYQISENIPVDTNVNHSLETLCSEINTNDSDTQPLIFQ